MFQVKEKTVGKAWIKSLQIILDHGTNEKDNNVPIKEVIQLAVVIDNAIKEDKIVQKFGDSSMIEWMKGNFLTIIPINLGYSYGKRLTDFDGVNQIDRVIKKLRDKPESKGATMTFLKPTEDTKHIPCICVIDFKLRNNKLISSAFFRSQDIGKKFYADALCLGEIQAKIAKELGVSVGSLVFFIASAHIYESDLPKITTTLASTT